MDTYIASRSRAPVCPKVFQGQHSNPPNMSTQWFRPSNYVYRKESSVQPEPVLKAVLRVAVCFLQPDWSTKTPSVNKKKELRSYSFILHWTQEPSTSSVALLFKVYLHYQRRRLINRKCLSSSQHISQHVTVSSVFGKTCTNCARVFIHQSTIHLLLVHVISLQCQALICDAWLTWSSGMIHPRVCDHHWPKHLFLTDRIQIGHRSHSTEPRSHLLVPWLVKLHAPQQRQHFPFFS